MSEFNLLLDNVKRYVTLSEEEEEELKTIMQVNRIRRRQYIVQPGFVCLHRNFVVKGSFRSFFIDKEGKDHTLQIAVEDWFISDFHSYITQTPATMFVEALEDSVIIQMTYNDIEGLCSKMHSLSEYFRISTERAFAFSRKRVQANLSMSAEERYLEFLDRYPGIVQRVPQYVVASYLGMSAEFLSKIRANLAQKS